MSLAYQSKSPIQSRQSVNGRPTERATGEMPKTFGKGQLMARCLQLLAWISSCAMGSSGAADHQLGSSPPHSFDLLQRIIAHADERPSSVAITDPTHRLSISYSQLCQDTVKLAHRILALVNGRTDLSEGRICILCTKGYLVPLSMLAIWAAGGLAVPLLPGMPLPEHDYMMENSEAELIICDELFRSRADDLVGAVERRGGRCQIMQLDFEAMQVDRIEGFEDIRRAIPLEGERRAMMLYTSGTVRFIRLQGDGG